jgi:hypothetical protein
MKKVFDIEYQKIIRIDNVSMFIAKSYEYQKRIESDNYKTIDSLKKELIKKNVTSFIQNRIYEIIANNKEFIKIEIDNFKLTYNKDFKYLELTINYNDDREYIKYIQDCFNKFKNVLSNDLFAIDLYIV